MGSKSGNGGMPGSLPNQGASGGVNIGPNYNPLGGPAGYNGQPQQTPWWLQGGAPTGPSQPGNVMGGGSPSSLASTEGFNQFLQQFMQSGGMQQMMGGYNQSQFNPYQSLINPNIASQVPQYKPQMPGTPPGYKPPGYTPVAPGQPFVPGTSPYAPPGGFPGTITNPNGKPVSQAPPSGWNMPGSPSDYKPSTNTMVPFDPSSWSQINTNPVSTDGGFMPFAGGPANSVNAPPGQPSDINGGWVTDPTGFSWEGGLPTGGPKPMPGSTPSGPNTNQYGMPTGGVSLTPVNGQYNPAAFNPFSGQAPRDVNGTSGAWNDPAFLTMLQKGLGGQASLGDTSQAGINDPAVQAVQSLYSRNADRNVADLRARYGMGGGSNLGSAAALAEGNYRAEDNAQTGTAMANIIAQSRGLDLTQRGQDMQNYLGSRGLDVNQLGLMAQNNQFGGDLGLRAGIANQNADMGWQQLLSQNNQFGNLFKQNDAQFGATFGQNAQVQNNQFGLQNQQQQNQYGLGVAAQGAQQQQMAQQQQQFMFEQMMKAYMAQAGWNTPQADNVVKPSTAEQLAQWANIGATIYGGYQNRNR